ncbi:MAG: radical SAM protein [Humidesulfovibrio sp.]|uniref:radical SAM protein n=1 Tax=Humidesulfovibrio sp. TaxID=2910988 RepID=UPI0027370F40|nr:radical SAM protein [Humidesulfovibrio sp.]MDP2848306.1 radical SAM protein [Humidesulfovibrio sp.]
MNWGWQELVLSRLGAPELDWVQVEITTRCNALCCYCPRTALGERWSSQDMPVALFRSLLRFLGRTKQIHLQGWGEPLLHPHFFDMVSWCKEKGLMVSTTTNGNMLDADSMKRLVELEVDVIGVSLAGVRPETNDAMRSGTSMAQLVAKMGQLAEMKTQMGRQRPEVHLAYLNVSDSLEDLAILPELAAAMGISKVMISEPSPALTPEVPGRTHDRERKALALREAAYSRIQARSQGLGVDVFWASCLRESAGCGCTENPGAACVVGVEGHVAPCVFCADVLAGTGEARATASLAFGDIRQTSLTRIWNAPEYIRFRTLFSPKTLLGDRRWPAPCLACPQRKADDVREA